MVTTNKPCNLGDTPHTYPQIRQASGVFLTTVVTESNFEVTTDKFKVVAVCLMLLFDREGKLIA